MTGKVYGRIPPPKRCPNMKECVRIIDWDHFDSMCDTDSWIFCSRMQKEARKFKRKPCDWKLVKELGGLKQDQDPCEVK